MESSYTIDTIEEEYKFTTIHVIRNISLTLHYFILYCVLNLMFQLYKQLSNPININRLTNHIPIGFSLPYH